MFKFILFFLYFKTSTTIVSGYYGGLGYEVCLNKMGLPYFESCAVYDEMGGSFLGACLHYLLCWCQDFWVRLFVGFCMLCSKIVFHKVLFCVNVWKSRFGYFSFGSLFWEDQNQNSLSQECFVGYNFLINERRKIFLNVSFQPFLKKFAVLLRFKDKENKLSFFHDIGGYIFCPSKNDNLHTILVALLKNPNTSNTSCPENLLFLVKKHSAENNASQFGFASDQFITIQDEEDKVLDILFPIDCVDPNNKIDYLNNLEIQSPDGSVGRDLDIGLDNDEDNRLVGGVCVVDNKKKDSRRTIKTLRNIRNDYHLIRSYTGMRRRVIIYFNNKYFVQNVRAVPDIEEGLFVQRYVVNLFNTLSNFALRFKYFCWRVQEVPNLEYQMNDYSNTMQLKGIPLIIEKMEVYDSRWVYNFYDYEECQYITVPV